MANLRVEPLLPPQDNGEISTPFFARPLLWVGKQVEWITSDNNKEGKAYLWEGAKRVGACFLLVIPAILATLIAIPSIPTYINRSWDSNSNSLKVVHGEIEIDTDGKCLFRSIHTLSKINKAPKSVNNVDDERAATVAYIRKHHQGDQELRGLLFSSMVDSYQSKIKLWENSKPTQNLMVKKGTITQQEKAFSEISKINEEILRLEYMKEVLMSHPPAPQQPVEPQAEQQINPPVNSKIEKLQELIDKQRKQYNKKVRFEFEKVHPGPVSIRKGRKWVQDNLGLLDKKIPQLKEAIDTLLGQLPVGEKESIELLAEALCKQETKCEKKAQFIKLKFTSTQENIRTKKLARFDKKIAQLQHEVDKLLQWFAARHSVNHQAEITGAIDNYLNNLSKPKAFGGEAELHALSKRHNICIQVHRKENGRVEHDPWKIFNEGAENGVWDVVHANLNHYSVYLPKHRDKPSIKLVF